MSDAPPRTAMPEETPKPARFDPWAANRSGTARWYAISTAIHVGLLFLFATATLTVVRVVEEIRVSVVDDVAIGEDILDGADSLQDLAGVLQMERTAPQQAAPKGPAIGNVRAPVLPRPSLGNIGPKIGANPDLAPVSAGAAAAFGTGGAGALGGLGGSFGDYVGGLRKVGLDVVLVIDATSSMQFVIDDVRDRLTDLVGTLQRLVPTARVGIVVYRDQGDEYVTKWSDLSFHTSKLKSFLADITADGGGDFEEAVLEALEVAVQDLNWRKKSKRVLILVGDAPPHEWDVKSVHGLVRDFQRDRGVVHAIDVTKQAHYLHDLGMWRAIHGRKTYEPSPLPEFRLATSAAFRAIAEHGGGEMIDLDQGKQLIRNILELTFGARWKTEMKQFLEELS